MKTCDKSALPAYQKDKIEIVKLFIKENKSGNCLQHIVIIFRVTVVASFLKCNSETIWTRVRNPETFRFEEMKIMSDILDIPISEFMDILDNQIEYNSKLPAKRLLVNKAKARQLKMKKKGQN